MALFAGWKIQSSKKDGGSMPQTAGSELGKRRFHYENDRWTWALWARSGCWKGKKVIHIIFPFSNNTANSVLKIGREKKIYVYIAR